MCDYLRMYLGKLGICIFSYKTIGVYAINFFITSIMCIWFCTLVLYRLTVIGKFSNDGKLLFVIIYQYIEYIWMWILFWYNVIKTVLSFYICLVFSMCFAITFICVQSSRRIGFHFGFLKYPLQNFKRIKQNRSRSLFYSLLILYKFNISEVYLKGNSS